MPGRAVEVTLTGRHDPYAALRHRDYRIYAVGWLFTTLAYQMQFTAVLWEVHSWTHSAMTLGLVGGIRAGAIILLTLLAGHVADVFDRKYIAMIGEVLWALSCVGLAALSWAVSHGQVRPAAAVPLLYGLVAMGEIVSTFIRPARDALLPQIVPTRFYTNALSWTTSIFNISRISGPVLAMIIYAISPLLVYVASIGASLTFLICLALVRHRPTERTDRISEPHQLVAGIRFVWRTKLILATLTLDLFAVLLGGVHYLLPMFAQRLCPDWAEQAHGLLRAAEAAGALGMAILIAYRPPTKHAGWTLLLSVTGFALATIVFGLSQWFWVSMLALVAAGALDNISVVVRHSLVQLLTPDRMRGRVSAVNWIFIGASNDLGGLESGVAAKLLGGIAISAVVGGIGAIGVVIFVALIWPQILRLRSLQDLSPESAGDEGNTPAVASNADGCGRGGGAGA